MTRGPLAKKLGYKRATAVDRLRRLKLIPDGSYKQRPGGGAWIYHWPTIKAAMGL